jgi:hypothetical protein
MTINTIDKLVDALGNNSSRVIFDKAQLTGQTAASFVSFWRATGQPGQGAIPAAAAVCDNTLMGAVQFAQQTDPVKSYLGILEPSVGIGGTSVELHDRLMHMGGLSGTVTTAQTVGIDLQANLGTANLDARRGDTNYSDVQWWLEWYSATGATVVTATVNVTYDDGSTGNLTAVSLAASRPASHMIALNNLMPAAASGRYIRGVNSVTLSATTGTAGSFGVTATRYRAGVYAPVANARFTADWAALGLPQIPNSACLFAIIFTVGASTGLLRIAGKIAHG